MSRSILVYFGAMGFFLACIIFLVYFDNPETAEQLTHHVAPSSKGGWEIFITMLLEEMHHPLSQLILQIATIIMVARFFSYLARMIGQPAVIGEIVAGIVLGPSLIGTLLPDVSAFLFPKESLPNLKMFSQIGLVLFMFIVGMELDIRVLRSKAHTALFVSHMSIVFMHFVGFLLGSFLYQSFAGDKATYISFGWFMGIAMSITAFPVLARIVQERNLNKTPLGSIIITCAAADDVTAWCILATLIGWANAGSVGSAIFTLLFFGLYILFMFYVVQPFLRRASEVYVSREVVSRPVVAMFFLLLLLSAYITEVLGIHALFGAFLAGVIMPQNTKFKEILTQKIEDVSAVLLLPLFFVFTGLRTQIDTLNSVDLWLVAGLVILVAAVGKITAVTVTAKLLKQSWQNSLMMGVLMNTRGLMELIVLNIGYDLGILNKEIFTIMVLMALVTTFMTGPALNLIEFWFGRLQRLAAQKNTFNVLISFGPPAMGQPLLKVAHVLTQHLTTKPLLSALHLTPNSEVSITEAQVFEQESFAPIKETAEELQVSLQTIYKTSEKVISEIVKATEDTQAHLLLMGSAKSIFDQNITGGIIRQVFKDISCQAGILIEKNLTKLDAVLIVIFDEQEDYLLDWGAQLHKNTAIKNIRVMDIYGHVNKNHPWLQKNPALLQANPLFASSFLQQFDLVIVGFDYWEANPNDYEDWKYHTPSVLILRPAPVKSEQE